MNGPTRPNFSLPPSPERVESTVDDEFRFHLEERRAQLIAEGMSPDDADREVQRRFGDVASYKRETAAIDHKKVRAERRAGFIASLWRETLRAVRLLTRDRGFATTAAATLGLGLAGVMATYAVVHDVLLKPLPYPDPTRVVAVRHPSTVPGSGERIWGLSTGGYVHLRDHAKSFEAFGIYSASSFTVLKDGESEVARVARATPGALSVLGARVEIGTFFSAEDAQPGGADVAILSAEYHRSQFGGDPAAVGTILETANGSYQIIGVAAPGLTVPMPGPFADASDLTGFGVDVWLPLRVNEAGPFYNSHPYVGVARLAEGVDVASANTELTSLLARFPEWMPQAYTASFLQEYDFRIAATPLHDAVIGPQLARALWLLLAAVTLMLAAAVANVANLFLARIEARRQEAAVRSALGASTSQMTAHYAAESLLVCGCAFAFAVGLAYAAVAGLPWFAPRDVPLIHDAALGVGAIGLGAALALLIAAALALAPALRRTLDIDALRDGRTLGASPRRRLLRQSLMVAQLAATVILLSGAAMLVRGARTLRNVDAGFEPDGVVAFQVWLPFSSYDTRERASVFYRDLEARLRSIPGVTAVGFGPLPLQDFGTACSVVFREGRPYDVGEQPPCVSTPVALPGWFGVLDIDVAGERPTWRDVDARTQAVVVTQALADRLWPGEDAIGRGIGSNGPDSESWYRVVGVVPELRAEALDAPPTEAVFYAATGLVPDQRTDAINYLSVLVRTSLDDPMQVVPGLQAAVRQLDARVPVVKPRTLPQVVSRSMGRLNFLLALIGVAALVAFTLSTVGTYGVVSYMMMQRRTEMGIRMALGATAGNVVRLVASQSVRVALIGVTLGVLGAVYASQVLETMVFTGGGAGPVLLLAVAGVLVGVVLLASVAPARAATRVDPSEALRG